MNRGFQKSKKRTHNVRFILYRNLRHGFGYYNYIALFNLLASLDTFLEAVDL